MISIQSPAEYASSLKKSLSAEQKLAFISTFLIGFFCHLFIFTNHFFNNDDIRNLYIDQDRSDLGRWFQTYAGGISSYFSLPALNGLLSLFYAGIAAMLLVHLFQLKNKLNIIFVSGIMICFPTVVCLYSYMFAADPFLLCLLLSIAAAWFVTRINHKWFWIPGAVCLCFSVGIYQGYLSFTVVLLLLFFILMLLKPQEYSDKLILTMLLRYILMLGSGMVSYAIIMFFSLQLKHITLSDYQGISESSVPGLTQIKLRFINLSKDFIHFFGKRQLLAFNPWMQAALIATIALLAISFFTLFISNKVYKSPLRNALLFLCIICIPPAVNVIYLISDNIAFHAMMRHSWCLLFIALAIFAENVKPLLRINRQILLEWVSFITLFLVLWNYMILANIAYFNMNFRYQKTYAFCLEVRDKLKAYEDYDNDLPIAFIGNYSKTYKMDAVTDLLEPVTGTYGPRIFKGASRAYLPFFQNCLGEDITVVSPQREAELKATPEFQEMPRYPHDGCIRIIDGATVIKLNDD